MDKEKKEQLNKIALKLGWPISVPVGLWVMDFVIDWFYPGEVNLIHELIEIIIETA